MVVIFPDSSVGSTEGWERGTGIVRRILSVVFISSINNNSFNDDGDATVINYPQLSESVQNAEHRLGEHY